MGTYCTPGDSIESKAKWLCQKHLVMRLTFVDGGIRPGRLRDVGGLLA
jgi:hypothetical protein